MSAVRIESRLRELVRAGALRKSACSSELLSFVAPLLDSGVLGWKRRGAGRALVALDDATLRDFVARHFPVLVSELPPGTSQRLAALARFRDTKALRCDTPDILTIRAWSAVALRKNGKPIMAAEATRSYGIFSFVLTPGEKYELCAPCALVEGPELLLGFERLSAVVECPLVIYGGGRISQRVLEWLTEQTAPKFYVLHLPDYDPVGLNEYVRLHTALGRRVRLHMPADLEDSFARFANPDLLSRAYNQLLLRGLRSSEIPEVAFVRRLIEHYHAGLEQEQLLLPITRSAVAL